MRPSKAVDHLVVYGTLLHAVQHPCHAILTELAEFKGRVHFHGILYDLGEYPGVQLSDDPRDLVCGELYRLLDVQTALTRLDAYEGYDPLHPRDALFCRTEVNVFQPDVPAQSAWIYCYNRSVMGRERIVSGNYLEFLRAKTVPRP